MNRRSLLAYLGFAPLAVSVSVAAKAKDSFLVIDGETCGVSIRKIDPCKIHTKEITLDAVSADKMIRYRYWDKTDNSFIYFKD